MANRSRELLNRYTRSGLSFGDFAVDGFFILSGFLITRSWQMDPDLPSYLKKRLLRIVPGYVVAAALSVVIIGLLAPATPNFFKDLLHAPWNRELVISTVTLDSPMTPPAFPGLPYHDVNSAPWTLPYEFRCYLAVAVFGTLGLFRWRLAWLTATVIALIAYLVAGPLSAHLWHHFYWILGRPNVLLRLFPPFLVGGCFFLYQAHIRFRPAFALIAAAGLAICFSTGFIPEIALFLCGSYLLIYIGQFQLGNRGWVNKVPDISYGMYLYGWPTAQLALWYLHPGPWMVFVLSLISSVALGLLSWHLVERPMLTLKPKPHGDPARGVITLLL